MSIVKVTGTTFIRDTNSMGLSNINPVEREEYFAKKRLIANQKAELNSIRTELDTLKTDVSDIKELLLKLLDKGS